MTAPGSTRNHELHRTLDLVTEECCNCGITFAMPRAFRQQCLDNPGRGGKSFYCPNGHGQHFTGKTEAQRQRERVDSLEHKLEWSRARERATRDQLDAAERSRRAIKGHLTRLRNKIANGVCPCCRRNFTNVRDHMRDQHPQWVDMHAEALR